MDGATCATCPWWSRFPESVEFRWDPGDNEQREIRTPNERGECRLWPPRPARDFPVTAQDDWCGQHPERLVRGDAR